jgi:hypothetical protein
MAKIEPMTIRVDCDDFKSAAERFAESFERFERSFYERFGDGEPFRKRSIESEPDLREAAKLMIALCEANENPDAETEWWVRGYNALAAALEKSAEAPPSRSEADKNLIRFQRSQIENLKAAIVQRLEAAAKLVVELDPGRHGREFRERLANEIRKLKV